LSFRGEKRGEKGEEEKEEGDDPYFSLSSAQEYQPVEPMSKRRGGKIAKRGRIVLAGHHLPLSWGQKGAGRERGRNACAASGIVWVGII